MSTTNGSAPSSAVDVLAAPLTLPCGKVMPNRIAKAPLAEMLGKAGGSAPTESLLQLYDEWAKGGWGMLITGNVAIDRTHLGTPFDISLPSPPYTEADLLARFKRYADVTTGRSAGIPASQRPLAVVQLVHAGRQSTRGSGRPLSSPALAPSALPMKTFGSSPIGKLMDWAIWGTPQEMSKAQIANLVEMFASAAELMAKSGFDGVEIHGSHGYQIAAFLSPKTNLRTDEYGGDAKGRAKLLMEVIDAVRKRVPKDFAVGVKLNSSDYVAGGLTEDDALLNVKWLAEHGGVDFVEISGGNYENPSFVMDGFDSEAELAALSAASNGSKPSPAPKQPSERSKAREAFFQNFAQRCRASLPSSSKMALILTGGLRTRLGMAEPLASGAVDAVAIGRPATLYPDFPRIVLDKGVRDDDPKASPPKVNPPKSILTSLSSLKITGAGWQTLWHDGMMAYIARRQSPNSSASTLLVLLSVFFPSLFSPRGQVTLLSALVALVALAVWAAQRVR